MKIWLCACVVVLCGAIGQLYGKRYKRREKILTQLRQWVLRMGHIVTYHNPPLPQLLRQSANLCGEDVEALVNILEAELRKPHASLGHIFHHGLSLWRHSNAGGQALLQDDVLFLNTLPSLWLMQEHTVLSEALGRFAQEMEKRCASAKESSEKEGKLYQKLGWLGGIFLAIFML